MSSRPAWAIAESTVSKKKSRKKGVGNREGNKRKGKKEEEEGEM